MQLRDAQWIAALQLVSHMLQNFQTWLLKLVAESWCLQQGLSVSHKKTCYMWKQLEISPFFGKMWEREEKPVLRSWRRGWIGQQLKPWLVAFRRQNDTATQTVIRCLPAGRCFYISKLRFVHLNNKSSAHALLKASEHPSLVSISTDVMCLIFKSQGHVTVLSRRRKAWSLPWNTVTASWPRDWAHLVGRGLFDIGQEEAAL